MKRKETLGSVLRRMVAEHAAVSLLSVLVIAASVAAALLPPLVLEQVVDRLVAGQEVPLAMALGYFGLLALSGLLEAGQNVMITVFGQKVTHALRSTLCRKLRALPAAYFVRHEAGKITSRFVNDVDAVDSLFTNGIVSMFADACRVVSILVVIFCKSKGLGLLMLLVTPLLFCLTRYFQRRMLTAQMENRAAVAKVNNHVPETLRCIRMIHVFSRERYMEERYDGYIDESYRATDRSNLYDSIYSPIVILVSACVVSVMMIGAAMGGGVRAFFGIGVGTAVAVIAYVSRAFEPIESIGMEIQNIQTAVAGVRRIDEFLSEEEREIPAGSAGEILTPETPAVRFERVCFGYDEQGDVLHELSFAVARGEAVTFVGRTGAGKSTVFRLLLGLYRPRTGRVLVGETAADAIPEERKRALFGYVEQTFHPVDGTIAQQISLFDAAITPAAVEKAARLVGLHETIAALPQGYDTPFAATAFSQGQRQLLSIARAVAASPAILLLDEITANLDSETERRLLEALERAAKGRTVLSVSHRLQRHSGRERLLPIGAATAENL